MVYAIWCVQYLLVGQLKVYKQIPCSLQWEVLPKIGFEVSYETGSVHDVK